MWEFALSRVGTATQSHIMTFVGRIMQAKAARPNDSLILGNYLKLFSLEMGNTYVHMPFGGEVTLSKVFDVLSCSRYLIF